MKSLIKLIPIILSPFVVGMLLPEPKIIPASEGLPAANPEHLDGAFTGGFGEETCRSCHFDYDLNMDGGSLDVSGIPGSIEPGDEYEIIVTVESEQLEVGGFQMTARFDDGSQAGEFSWSGDQLMFTPSVPDTLQYLQHSAEGTSPTEERKVQWSFTWKAPEDRDSRIIFNIAANAGNNDDSSFGDWIYAEEIEAEVR